MSYVVLARKWRPMTFDDLVGQDHVARTLGNAIESGRVAHAFLFTGVRGVGKTTSARILAKALNCMGKPGTVPPGEDPGPTVTPCLECPACLEIATGADMDVREIDGASYNGVDEVRKLQDSLPYRPTRDRFKIFIVDEVHMLSQAAWNAFLKTLEEPPPHVKFIFATTEVHKVPVTILSRVQRFDFKMIPTRAIAERVKYVLSKESIQADDGSVAVVAREAAGSMRDAMSLLDQVIAFSGQTLVEDDVARVLGVASRQALFDLAEGLVQGDAGRCLRSVAALADQGFDIAHVARDLLAYLRDLVVAAVCPEPGPLLELADEEQADVLELARGANTDDLMRLHRGFSLGFDEIVRGASPRASLEMLLVRLARRPALVPVDDLIQRLGNLERRFAAGGSGTKPTPPRGRPEPPPAARRDAPQRRGREGESPRARRPDQPSASPDDAGDGGPPSDFGPAQTQPRELPSTPRVSPVVPPEAPPAPSLSAPNPQGAHGPALASSSTDPGGTSAATMSPGLTPRSARRPATDEWSPPPFPEGPASSVVAKATPNPATEPLPPEEVERLSAYKSLVERIAEKNLELSAYLEHAVPLAVGPGGIELAFERGSLWVETIEKEESFALIESTARDLFGTTVTIRRDHPGAEPHRTLSAERVREREQQRRDAIHRARTHPRVIDAIEVFGGRVKDVKIPGG